MFLKIPGLLFLFSFVYFTYQVISCKLYSRCERILSKMSEADQQKDTYQTIVKTAQQLFMELGYRAVSTRQIAEKCSITQPALYHYFKNKQALYVAVNQYTLLQTGNALNQILSVNQSFKDRLQQIAIYMMDHFDVDLSQMFHDIFHELEDHHQQEIQKGWVKGFLMPIVRMIDEGVEKREVRDPAELGTNSTELAFMILNVIKSSLEQPKKANEPKQAADSLKKAKLVIEIFLNGIGK